MSWSAGRRNRKASSSRPEGMLELADVKRLLQVCVRLERDGVCAPRVDADEDERERRARGSQTCCKGEAARRPGLDQCQVSGGNLCRCGRHGNGLVADPGGDDLVQPEKLRRGLGDEDARHEPIVDARRG